MAVWRIPVLLHDYITTRSNDGAGCMTIIANKSTVEVYLLIQALVRNLPATRSTDA